MVNHSMEYHMSTYVPKLSEIRRQWHLVDADGMVLGRLATRVATLLSGKHKPMYVPFLDTGDFVVVVNAEKVELTGRKLEQKFYRRHSGYMGGLKETQARKMKATRPEHVIAAAVRGMLPKNKIGQKMFSKLKIYRGPAHRHQAQRPVEFKIS